MRAVASCLLLLALTACGTATAGGPATEPSPEPAGSPGATSPAEVDRLGDLRHRVLRPRCIQVDTVPVDGTSTPTPPALTVDPDVWPPLFVECPPAVPLR